MRLLPYVLALVLGIGAAGLSACGSSSSSDALIPSADAGPLREDFAAVGTAIARHDCTKAAEAVRSAQAHVDSLPRSTSEALTNRLQEGLLTLQRQAAAECIPAVDTTTTEATTTDTTATDTLPTDTTATETTPTDTTTDTIPTETTPTPTPNPGGAEDDGPGSGTGNGNGNAFGQDGA